MRKSDPSDRNLIGALDDRLDRLRRAGLGAIAPLVRGEKIRKSKRLGINLALDTSRYIDYLIYMQGVYEPETFDLIDSAIRGWNGRGQFLDVGANIGAMCTYVAARYAGTNVVAFEPVETMVERIRVQQELNGVMFRIEQIALSGSGGTLDLFLPNVKNAGHDYGKYNPGMTSAHPDEMHSVQTITARSATLDSLIDEGSAIDPALPTFVKIDVEGHESQVLRGMTGFLKAPGERWIVVEIMAAKHPERATEVWDLIRARGYRGEFVGRRRLYPCEHPRFDGRYLIRRTAING